MYRSVNRIGEVIKFLFKKRWLTLVLIAICLGLTIWIVQNHYSLGWLTQSGDRKISILTFLTTILIAYLTVDKDWENQLTKTLTVHFKFGDKYIMTCHDTYLAHEGDIRNWGQQIGGQMANGDRSLEFYPYLTPGKQTIRKRHLLSSNVTITEKHYEVTFHFRAIPIIKEPLLKNYYLVWWENDDHTEKNKSTWFKEQPCNYKSVEEAIANKFEPPIQLIYADKSGIKAKLKNLIDEQTFWTSVKENADLPDTVKFFSEKEIEELSREINEAIGKL